MNLLEKDTRKIKRLESIWEEVGVPFTEDIITGYIMSHFESIYLGIRKVVCINICIYSDKELAIQFINKCCMAFGCQIVHQDKGELWISKRDSWYYEGEIPSRFSEKEEDHRLRGQLLGYSDTVIDSYFIK